MILLIVINLIVLSENIQIILKKIRTSQIELFEYQRNRSNTIMNITPAKVRRIAEYLSLLVGTFVVVGSCNAY